MGKYKKLMRHTNWMVESKPYSKRVKSFHGQSRVPVFTANNFGLHRFSVKFNNLSKETTLSDLYDICQNRVNRERLTGSDRIIVCHDGDTNFGYINFCSLSDARLVVDFVRETKPILKGNNICIEIALRL